MDGKGPAPQDKPVVYRSLASFHSMNDSFTGTTFSTRLRDGTGTTLSPVQSSRAGGRQDGVARRTTRGDSRTAPAR